jgi:hypothetical protein
MLDQELEFQHHLDQQQMLRIERVSENEFTEEMFGNFSFVPMLEKTVR